MAGGRSERSRAAPCGARPVVHVGVLKVNTVMTVFGAMVLQEGATRNARGARRPRGESDTYERRSTSARLRSWTCSS